MNVKQPGWAERFRRESHGLTRHFFWPGFWPDPQPILDMLTGMFTEFDDPFDPPALRIFVDNGLRYDLAHRLVPSPHRGRLSFEQWTASRIGARRFCLTLNGLTRWSEPFHSLMQRDFVNPLIAAIGAPHAGADFYAFMGNYGLTPFGIHDDADHSLLIHLGPHPKPAYIWPRRTYLKTNGGAGPSFDFRRLRTSAIRYVLHPGDLLFIPQGDFHVLDSRRFAASLGFTIFPDTPESELSEAAKLCDELRAPAVLLALRRSRLLLASNGWISVPPRLARTPVQGPFQVPETFPLLHRAMGGSLEIFVRGRSLRLRRSPELIHMIRFLNRCRPFDYPEFAATLDKTLQPSAARLIFEQLCRLGGVQRVTPENP